MDEKAFNLKNKDRLALQKLTKTGNRNSREFEHAYILLALDNGKKQKDIVDFFQVNRITIWRVKKKYVEHGLEAALKDEDRPGQPVKYKEKEIAEVVATACSEAPEGHARWTLRLLASTLKKRKGFESINRETIRLILKKTNVSLG